MVFFDQHEYDLRCEWGLEGLRALAPASDAVVIVDVLSFSTAVDVAVANGASVLPCPFQNEAAEQLARASGALLASRRASADGYSLSPASLQSIPAGTALVLPSPNGSTLSLSAPRIPTFTACLRNAPAVAKGLAGRIALIPAGERWDDGTLRPCLEDWIGAGAVLAHLPGSRSPEAELAIAAFEHFRGDLYRALSGCGSGKELIGRGFAHDVELAAEFAVSTAVPVLAADRFVHSAS